MTIIDTTLYCNGELRLAKHGPRGGGTVLTHVPSGEQLGNIGDIEAFVAERAKRYQAWDVFNEVASRHGRAQRAPRP